MLIRTQNKEGLYNLNALNGLLYNESHEYNRGKDVGIKHEICIDTGVLDAIAEYSTKEKAIKVLDMIQEKYCEPVTCDVFSDNEKYIYSRSVFQMPQDSEVGT
ncbi:MAG: hypothetical protein E7293_03295 [Lachnospiraceae bacterium]|nr:hypothetical protein [Lachnospiraceae bacterium]